MTKRSGFFRRFRLAGLRWLALILTVQLALPTAIARGESRHERAEFNRQMTLMTWFLYANVLADYVAEGDKFFASLSGRLSRKLFGHHQYEDFAATKAFLDDFLPVWFEYAASGRYRTSRDIFYAIYLGPRAIARRMSHWDRIHMPLREDGQIRPAHFHYFRGITEEKVAPIHLGYQRKELLSEILVSELKADLRSRILVVREKFLMDGITHGGPDIADPNSGARAILALLSGWETALKLTPASATLALERLSRHGRANQVADFMLGKDVEALALALGVGFARVAEPAIVSGVARGWARTRQVFSGLKTKLHDNSMAKALGVSVATHGLVVAFAPAKGGKPAVNEGQTATTGATAPVKGLRPETPAALAATPSVLSEPSRENLLKVAQRGLRLHSGHTSPYVGREVMLQYGIEMDKALGGSRRFPEAGDYEVRLRATAAEVEAILARGTELKNESELIDQIRRTVIEGYLERYEPNRDLITGAVRGDGANCVAQTLIFLDILSRVDLKHRLPHWQLGVRAYRDHLAPVLWNESEKTSWDLVNGSLHKNPKSSIFHPNVVVLGLVRGLGFVGEHNLAAFKFWSASEQRGWLDQLSLALGRHPPERVRDWNRIASGLPMPMGEIEFGGSREPQRLDFRGSSWGQESANGNLGGPQVRFEIIYDTPLDVRGMRLPPCPNASWRMSKGDPPQLVCNPYGDEPPRPVGATGSKPGNPNPTDAPCSEMVGGKRAGKTRKKSNDSTKCDVQEGILSDENDQMFGGLSQHSARQLAFYTHGFWSTPSDISTVIHLNLALSSTRIQRSEVDALVVQEPLNLPRLLLERQFRAAIQALRAMELSKLVDEFLESGKIPRRAQFNIAQRLTEAIVDMSWANLTLVDSMRLLCRARGHDPEACRQREADVNGLAEVIEFRREAKRFIEHLDLNRDQWLKRLSDPEAYVWGESILIILATLARSAGLELEYANLKLFKDLGDPKKVAILFRRNGSSGSAGEGVSEKSGESWPGGEQHERRREPQEPDALKIKLPTVSAGTPSYPESFFKVVEPFEESADRQGRGNSNQPSPGQPTFAPYSMPVGAMARLIELLSIYARGVTSPLYGRLADQDLVNVAVANLSGQERKLWRFGQKVAENLAAIAASLTDRGAATEVGELGGRSVELPVTLWPLVNAVRCDGFQDSGSDKEFEPLSKKMQILESKFPVKIKATGQAQDSRKDHTRKIKDDLGALIEDKMRSCVQTFDLEFAKVRRPN